MNVVVVGEDQVWIKVGREKIVPHPCPHLHPAKTKRKKENLQPDGENERNNQ